MATECPIGLRCDRYNEGVCHKCWDYKMEKLTLETNNEKENQDAD